MSLELPKGITKAEQETVIRWDEDEKVVTVWSASPAVLRKLARLRLTPTSERRRRDGALHGREYRLPLAGFSWGVKRKARRLSEGERQAARERLLRARAHSQEAVSSTERLPDKPEAA